MESYLKTIKKLNICERKLQIVQKKCLVGGWMDKWEGEKQVEGLLAAIK